MRVGKKANVVDVKRTRSCVVRLEKVSTISPNVSPSPEENRSVSRTNRLSKSGMTPTAKGRRGVLPPQQEDKTISGTAKKKSVGGNINVHSNFQTPQQQKVANINISNTRSNQKVKIIPRSNKTTPASTPSREETPPPTIAAGRSRRAIKPNPKYASDDLVTPKVVRNVALLASSGSRGGQTGQRTRKASTSSDDFYNRNSEDEYDKYGNDMENDAGNDESQNDKAYQVSEKDDHDSDFSVIDEAPARIARTRGRAKKPQDSSQSITQQVDNKLPTQTPIMKRTASAVTANSSNLRSAPSQLQQIRRSLASANTQRNSNLLTGTGDTSQKRKLEEVQDTSDKESSYSTKRKQILLSNSSEQKVKLPVRENRFNATTTPFTKSGFLTHTKVYKAQHLNGSNKISNVLITSRRAVESIAKPNSDSLAKSPRQPTTANIIQNNRTNNQNPLSTQAKSMPSKPLRIRSGSPKLPLQKERPNNGAAISISSSPSSSNSSLNINKMSDKIKIHSTQCTMKPKAASSQNLAAINSEIVHEIKDDSPNSTIDDFETMPTFTIVNVNDIINKKGDVLITKSKSNSNSNMPTVIEFTESISLDDDEEDANNDDLQEVEAVVPVVTRPKQILSKKMPKLPTLNNKKDIENKKSSLTRSNDSLRKLPTQPQISTSTSTSNQAPQILNHKLGLRNSRITPKTTTNLTATVTSPDKPAPRILNSVVAKKTQPVKPMIANMEDSADESFPLSLDEDDEEGMDTEEERGNGNPKVVHISEKAGKGVYQNIMEVDTEDTESQNTEEDDTVLQMASDVASKVALAQNENTSSQRRRRMAANSNTPIIVSSNKKRLTPAAAKENSLTATNQQVSDTTTKPLGTRKSNTEKVVISKQGDKIIKKITCFETWYVLNMPVEPKRPAAIKNQLEMPLIRLANRAKNICLPNHLWTCKVTLYELSPQTLLKGTFITYTGDLYEHNISEEDRGKYQPSCVMFRRSIEKNQASRMPYDRAVIFKNKTFYTNIEGKNVRLVGAPSIISIESEIEILLEVVDGLTLQSEFVEHISIVQ